MEKRVLVYNNCTGIAETMEPLFKNEGIDMETASDIKELVHKLNTRRMHLILMDVELEDKGLCEGIELISNIRKRCGVPMIIISGQTAETAKIMALNSGADDYVVKGCNPLVLMARIKSQIRRYIQLASINECVSEVYRYNGLEVNDVTRSVYVDGRQVKLTPIEYQILKLLIKESGKVLSNDIIYESIWHMRAIGADNTIAVHVRHIREKIENNPKEPRYLKVVWGTGYKVG